MPVHRLEGSGGGGGYHHPLYPTLPCPPLKRCALSARRAGLACLLSTQRAELSAKEVLAERFWE